MRIVSIQPIKGASMVCSKRIIFYYWPTWEFNHGEVFRCIHGIQICVNYGNLRAVLSWMALFFANSARRDLSRFSDIFHIFSPGTFWVGGAGVGVVVGFCRPGGG